MILSSRSVEEQSSHGQLLCISSTTQYLLLPYHPVAGPHGLKHTVLNFTHRSGFAVHFFLLLLDLAPAAVVEALARGAHAHRVVISVHTTVATGPTVTDRLKESRFTISNLLCFFLSKMLLLSLSYILACAFLYIYYIDASYFNGLNKLPLLL